MPASNDFQTQNNGQEMALGKHRLRADRCRSTNRTTYQFHRCMLNGQLNCPLRKLEESHPKTDSPLAGLYAMTQKYLRLFRR